MTAIIIEPILEKLEIIDKKLDILLQEKEQTSKTVEQSFSQTGDTCTFFDEGKSLQEMIDENPDTLGELKWVITHPDVQKEKETPCTRTIHLAQKNSETTNRTFKDQKYWALASARYICTLRQMVALYLSAKKTEKTLSSCWMRVSDQYKSGDRLIVGFDADGVHVGYNWDVDAYSYVGLASSSIS